MKNIKLLSVLTITVLQSAVVGCSSSVNDLENEGVKIRKIHAVMDYGSTKTTTGYDNTGVKPYISWTDGDQVIVFDYDAADLRTNYKVFDLQSGAGTTAGEFEGHSETDYVTPGKSYQLVYPVSAATYSSTNPFPLRGSMNWSDLASSNWLVSTVNAIPTNGVLPSFTFSSSVALALVRVSVSGYNGESRYLSSFSIQTSDSTPVFSSGIFFNDYFEVSDAGYSSQAVGDYSSDCVLTNTTSTYFLIIPIRQISTIKPLTFTVNFGGGNLSSVTTASSYTPSAIFQNGYYYDIYMTLSFDSDNVPTLTFSKTNS